MIRERRGLVQSLVTAIATKPFILLAGISGSGKTQIARRIAAGLAAGHFEDGRFLGRPYGGVCSADGYKESLVRNGVVKDLQGEDGNKFVEIADLGDLIDESGYKRSGLEEVMKDRIAFMPVKPDWSDPQKVWGYYNPLTGLYYPTAATRVVMHAFLEFLAYGSAAPRHFLIFDEMNLARVEYYLSDILSLMECPSSLVGDMIRLGEMSKIHPFNRPLWTQSAPQIELGAEKSSHEQLYVGKLDRSWSLAYHYLSQGCANMQLKRMSIDLSDIINGADWARVVPPQLSFSPNLSIIGTVNIDETTFAFSPKVLDRAFVLEFNDMDFDAVCHDWEGYSDISEVVGVLSKILRTEHLHFGYRSIKEMLRYIQEARGNWSLCGDFLMLSKIFPKLRGGEDKLGSILPVLLAFCISDSRDFSQLHSMAGQIVEGIIDGHGLSGLLGILGLSSVSYPLSADKMFRMTRQMLESGLTSYF